MTIQLILPQRESILLRENRKRSLTPFLNHFNQHPQSHRFFLLHAIHDGIFLQAIGIPVYGAPGIFIDPDGNGTHGLNERLKIDSLYAGRDYLFDLVKLYAG